MMNIRHRFCRLGLLTVMAGAFFGGCSDPVEPPPDDLFGVWEWARSVGGFAGVTLTPGSEGYTLQLRITRPDRIQLDRDGAEEVVTTFELIRSGGTDRLRYGEPILGQSEHELRLQDGELVLIDPCCDGFTHTWLPRPE